VLCHTSQSRWVQRLQDQRADSTDQSRKIAMHDPRLVVWRKMAEIIAGGDHIEPRRNAVGCTREQPSEFDRKKLLSPVVLAHAPT
jgi:hypothetical protein